MTKSASLMLCCFLLLHGQSSALLLKNGGIRTLALPHEKDLKDSRTQKLSLQLNGKGKPNYGPAGRIRTAYSSSPSEKVRALFVKVAAIVKELMNMCEQFEGKGGLVNLQYRLSKIEPMILKYITTSQSLYV